jgi:hypothetical protein
MKLSFIILCFFFLAFNLQSRELSYKERLIVLNAKKTIEVKNHMQDKIRPADLPIRTYLSFQLMKKGCIPFKTITNDILESSDDTAEQTEKLYAAYNACSESTIGLTHIYISQKD